MRPMVRTARSQKPSSRSTATRCAMSRGGVEKIIRAPAHLRDSHPRKKKLTTELAYFRRHRHRMHYAKAQAQNLPIGSGVVEAACKTLATQRMKRSGMRWRHRGGQAILTFRALHQSERFERAWKLLSGTAPSRSRKTSCYFETERYIDVSVSELHPTGYSRSSRLHQVDARSLRFCSAQRLESVPVKVPDSTT